jgi:sugar phosphate permease
MYFCYAYCISVYLDWYPTYLKEHRGYSLKEMGLYASLPLLAGTLGDLMGGWLSDLVLRWNHNVTRARRIIAIAGFIIAAAGIVPAALTTDPATCVILSCLGVFGLELTVGPAWAIPLDIGGDYAGSVSSVMNMCGNIGGAISPAVLAYLVRGFGWHLPFLVASSLCVIAAALFLKIDAAQRIFPEESRV